MNCWLPKVIALACIAGTSLLGQLAWAAVYKKDNVSGKTWVRKGDTWVECPPSQQGRNPGRSPGGLPSDSSDQNRGRSPKPVATVTLLAVLAAAAAAAAAARKKRTEAGREQKVGEEGETNMDGAASHE